ncbi:MAG: cupredoxin domain-containing protein, partial [Chloroflexota bacterium]|nr:cupredoxin domain-containing protein [Chloroflexota bacterium]
MVRHLIIVLAVALLLVSSARQGAGAPAHPPAEFAFGLARQLADENVPLDLAWLALAPDDVPEPGYGVRSGFYLTLEGYARSVYDQEAAQAEFAQVATAAGYRRAYVGRLGLPSDEDPDNRARGVETTLAEYPDIAGEAAGYRLLAEAYDRFGHDQIQSAPKVGRASRVYRISGNNPQPYQGVRLLFRASEVVVVVSIFDYENDAPTTSEVVALAETVAARIERARAGDAPGLSLQVPRLRSEGVTTERDRYQRRASGEMPSYRQSSDSLRQADERNDRHRIAERYIYVVDWRDLAMPEGEPVNYTVFVDRFADADTAASYGAAAPGEWLDNQLAQNRRAEMVAGASGGVMGVVQFAADRGTAIASGYIGWVQIGDRVASVALSAVPAASRSAHNELMQRMINCLVIGQCLTPAPLPDKVRIAIAPGGTPEATTAVPVATPSLCAGGATPVAEGPSAGLDLAWIVPSPIHFGGSEAGLARGRHPTLLEYADWMPHANAGQRELAERLENAGWRAAYLQTIAVPSAEDPDLFARSLEVSVAEFTSGACATEALASVADALVASGHQQARSAPNVGQEAVALRRSLTSRSGKPYEVLRLLFRSDELVIDIAVIDWTDDAPPLSEAVRLAEVTARRIGEARAGKTPGLGLRVPRLEAPAIDTNRDAYQRRSGEQLPLYNQDPTALRETDDYNAGLSATDIYVYHAEWTNQAQSAAEPVAYEVAVFRFASETAATTWVEEMPERVVSGSGYHYVESVRDMPAVGDGSAAVELAFDRSSGGTARGYWGWVRVGKLGITVSLNGVPDVPRQAFDELLREAAACLSVACPERVELPATLTNPASRPVASDATPGGAAEGGQAAPPAKPVTITGFDIGWTYNGQSTRPGKPIAVTVAPGTTIWLPNEGASLHNFAVDALNIDVDMPAGETVQAQIPADAAAGEYEFYCNVPGHKQAGMAGTLRVRAEANAPAPAGTETPRDWATGSGEIVDHGPTHPFHTNRRAATLAARRR